MNDRVCHGGAWLAAAGLALVAACAAPGPAGLRHLDARGLTHLRRDFNGAADRTRAIVLVSPTCHHCVLGVSALERTLASDSAARVVVFVIWEPILPTDLGPPEAATLARLQDSRARHYWDPKLLVSAEVVKLWRARHQEQGAPADAKAWDRALVFPAGGQWGEMLPPPAFDDGPVFTKTAALKQALLGAPAN